MVDVKETRPVLNNDKERRSFVREIRAVRKELETILIPAPATNQTLISGKDLMVTILYSPRLDFLRTICSMFVGQAACSLKKPST